MAKLHLRKSGTPSVKQSLVQTAQQPQAVAIPAEKRSRIQIALVAWAIAATIAAIIMGSHRG